MKAFHKSIMRYVILTILIIESHMLTQQAFALEEVGKLTIQFAGVVGIYLSTTAYVLKWFFQTKV